MSASAIYREAKFPPGDIGDYRYQRRSMSIPVDVLQTDGKDWWRSLKMQPTSNMIDLAGNRVAGWYLPRSSLR
jgi:hypothetical protein